MNWADTQHILFFIEAFVASFHNYFFWGDTTWCLQLKKFWDQGPEESSLLAKVTEWKNQAET